MHVLINAVSSSRHPSGICRHAASLSRCLAVNAEISKVTLIVGEWQARYFTSSFGPFDPKVQILVVDISRAALSRNWWYFNSLPTLASSCDADIVHLSFPVPIVRSRFRCPVVVSLHDLYPYDIPDNFGRFRAVFNRLFLRQCMSNVDHVACASEFTAARLRSLMPMLAKEKAECIYPCVDFNPQACQIPTQGDIRRPFILSVAQHRQNKNIPLLLKAFDDLLRRKSFTGDTRLVIVGGQGPLTNLILSQITAMSLEHNVVITSALPDSELCWLYKNCDLFVAPSSIEGFGFPVAEALCCGARIVCSDIPAFREIAGDKCHYFRLESASVAADLASACTLALSEHPPDPRPLDEFSSAALGPRYLAIYSRILRKQRGIAGNYSSPADQVMGYDPQLSEGFRFPGANILGLRIDAVNMSMAVETVESAVKNKRNGYVCVAGVHGVMEAFRDRDLASMFANAFLVVPDGMPTIWVGHLQGLRQMERVFGPDLMLELIARSQTTGFSHFLCGGDYGVAEELRHTLQQEFPLARIVGTYTPPFHSMTSEEEDQLVEKLNHLTPDIVWVGLSTPKQEKFMARLQSRVPPTVMIGVGAAFDFHTGRIKDSPAWVKRSGLQWCHRLMQEPSRLWKRYLVNNSQFLYEIGMQFTGMKHFDPPRRSGDVHIPQEAATRDPR